MKARRWIEWTGAPSPRNLQQGAGCELTELTKPQICQFCQFASGEQPKISRVGGSFGADRVDAAGVPWAEWKAAVLNRVFEEQGTTGQPGRITATTIRHGMRLQDFEWVDAKVRV